MILKDPHGTSVPARNKTNLMQHLVRVNITCIYNADAIINCVYGWYSRAARGGQSLVRVIDGRA